mgnify:CR=1 FL=1|tara:strand:+ start:192 stop:389 length:198 start_codon:yes stop_codon:yes gene_type:complete
MFFAILFLKVLYMMSDFTKTLKLYDEKIDDLELEIIKKDFDLQYKKILLKKMHDKKRKLLSSYKS